jgi:hypothetical protein
MDHGRVVLSLFVVAALIVGTAGYDSIQGDRSADVDVANDADAYLALEETGNTIQNGKAGTVLLLRNQFGTSVDLSITDVSTTDGVTYQGLQVSGVDTGDTATLGTGDTARLQVECTSHSDGSITVDIEATGDGISFETSRTVTVSCESSTTTTTSN